MHDKSNPKKRVCGLPIFDYQKNLQFWYSKIYLNKLFITFRNLNSVSYTCIHSHLYI